MYVHASKGQQPIRGTKQSMLQKHLREGVGENKIIISGEPNILTRKLGCLLSLEACTYIMACCHFLSKHNLITLL